MGNLTDDALAARDADRDIWGETLDGIQAIKQGQGKKRMVEIPDVRAIRAKMHLSQTAFAAMLGVSTRSLQDWEQGRRTPSGAALSLLKVAAIRPDAISDAIAA